MSQYMNDVCVTCKGCRFKKAICECNNKPIEGTLGQYTLHRLYEQNKQLQTDMKFVLNHLHEISNPVVE